MNKARFDPEALLDMIDADKDNVADIFKGIIELLETHSKRLDNLERMSNAPSSDSRTGDNQRRS